MTLGSSSSHAERIRAASGGLSTIHALLWAAYDQQLAKKYGIDMEYIAIENGTVGMQTLVANESQFLFSTSSLAVNANLRGADIAVVAGGLNFIPDKLIVRPEIKRPEDLAGKRLAISRFGSSSETSAKLTLEKVGVKPDSVSLIQLGGVSTRQAALMAGQVQATILSDPQATAATNAGMKLWVDLSESKWGLPRFCFNCFMAKRSFLDSNRAAASNFLKAVIEGLYLLKKDKASRRAPDKKISPPQRRGGVDRLRFLHRQTWRRHAQPPRTPGHGICHRRSR